MTLATVTATLQEYKEYPVEPFLHTEPTAVALLDLESGLEPTFPAGDSRPLTYRDALVLVRLHAEPLGMLYVDGRLEDLTRRELRELVWTRFRDEIQHHASRASCMPVPEDATDLAPPPRAPMCREGVAATPRGSVAVIVPTRGRSAKLARCLASLDLAAGPAVEIIVVENGPACEESNRTVESLAARTGRRIRYVVEPRPGSSVARNRGVAETSADIVAFTDNDVIVDRDWLRWLLEPFVADDVGATSGLVLSLELSTPTQKSFEQCSAFAKGWNRRSFDLNGNRADDRPLYPFWGASFGTGASMAFRRRDLVAAGGFDTALGAGSLALAGADIEALSATILRGRRLVYEPRSLAWHQSHSEPQALRRQLYSYGVGCTAILTKALLHDRRFLPAVARSARLLPVLRRGEQQRPIDHQPVPSPELVRSQWKGMLSGPPRYLRSVIWAHRHGLHRVIHGG
jgi:GT2 family glycosyltransferase